VGSQIIVYRRKTLKRITVLKFQIPQE